MANGVEAFKETVGIVPSRGKKMKKVRKIPSVEMTDENVLFVSSFQVAVPSHSSSHSTNSGTTRRLSLKDKEEISSESSSSHSESSSDEDEESNRYYFVYVFDFTN